MATRSATAFGHKQPRRRSPDTPRKAKASLDPRVGTHLLFARSTTRPGSPGAGPIRRCRFPLQSARGRELGVTPEMLVARVD